MGLLDSFKGFLGIGESGSGGSEDAFENFKKYAEYIGQQTDGYLQQLELRGYNQYANSLTHPFRGLDSAISQASARGASNLRGIAAALPGQLRQSALARTTNAQVSAVNAARVASGGRGGLAFGGGGAAIAARAGRDAGVQQSALLADSLAQANQARLGAEQAAVGLEQNALQQRLGLAGAMSQAMAQQGAMQDNWDSMVAQMQAGRAQSLYGLAGGALYGGLSGDVARQGRKTDLVSNLLF